MDSRIAHLMRIAPAEIATGPAGVRVLRLLRKLSEEDFEHVEYLFEHRDIDNGGDARLEQALAKLARAHAAKVVDAQPQPTAALPPLPPAPKKLAGGGGGNGAAIGICAVIDSVGGSDAETTNAKTDRMLKILQTIRCPGATDGERANATLVLQRMLDRSDMSLHDLQRFAAHGDATNERGVDLRNSADARLWPIFTWFSDVAEMCADLAGCRYYTMRALRRYAFYGASDAIGNACTLFKLMIDSIDLELAQLDRPASRKELGAVQEDFGVGATETVKAIATETKRARERALRTMRASSDATVRERALVHVQIDERVRAFYQDFETTHGMHRVLVNRHRGRSEGGYAAGRVAGHRIAQKLEAEPLV
jgi:hypothetical protein